MKHTEDAHEGSDRGGQGELHVDNEMLEMADNERQELCDLAQDSGLGHDMRESERFEGCRRISRRLLYESLRNVNRNKVSRSSYPI